MVESTTTIYDVARVAGVSMATVSRVVNGNANVKEKTRQKVLEAIAELDYRPNAVARGLASKRTTTVGVILPTITSTYFAAITRGVDDIASMYKYNMILANSDNDVEKEETLYNGYEYFPDITINDFEPRESTHEKNLENPDIDLTLTHWRKIKNHKFDV